MSDARTDFFATGAAKAPPLATREDFFAGKVDIDEKPATPETTARSKFSDPYGSFDPDVRRAAGVHEIGDEPYKSAVGGAAGFNSGVMHVLGFPVDTAANVVDLAGAGVGTLASLFGADPGEVYTPFDRAHTPLTGDWFSRKTSDITEKVGGERLTENPFPDSAGARVAFAAGQGVPLAIAAGGGAVPVAASASGGAAGAIGGELGLDPQSQIALSLLAGAGTASTAARAKAPPAIAPEARAAAAAEGVTRDTQAKLNAASSKQSMGAAGAAVDLQKLSPELRVAVEKAVKQTGGAVNPDVMARQIQADSLPVKVRLSEGQALGDERLISLEQNARGSNETYSKGFKAQNEALIGNLRAMRDETGPEVFSTNNVEHADTLIARYKAIDDADRAQISAKYKALEDANGGQLPVNGAKFVEAADAALGKKMKGRYLPAQVRGDLDEFRANAGYMTFEQFENLRTNLATEARSAERQGNGNAAAAINIVRRELEALPMSGENANLKGLADAARSAAKARFDRLDADPAYKAAVNDAVPPDTFVQKFVIKGERDNVERLSAAMADDPGAAQTLKVATLDHLRKAAGIDEGFNGNFTQAGYNKALQNLEPKLGSLLDAKTAETARNLGDVARYAQFQPKGSFVNNSNTFVAATADYGAHALEGAINYAAKGLPVGTAARKIIQSRKLTKQAEKTFAPGAGLTRLSDLPKVGEKK